MYLRAREMWRTPFHYFPHTVTYTWERVLVRSPENRVRTYERTAICRSLWDPILDTLQNMKKVEGKYIVFYVFNLNRKKLQQKKWKHYFIDVFAFSPFLCGLARTLWQAASKLPKRRDFSLFLQPFDFSSLCISSPNGCNHLNSD